MNKSGQHRIEFSCADSRQLVLVTRRRNFDQTEFIETIRPTE